MNEMNVATQSLSCHIQSMILSSIGYLISCGFKIAIFLVAVICVCIIFLLEAAVSANIT